MQGGSGTGTEVLGKTRTGIEGLDFVTSGGLPAGRTTLVCGGSGCGKTLLAMEFLVRGATRFDEPGVFMSFEETADELRQNFGGMGFRLGGLEAEGKLALDYVHVDRREIEETGEYDLGGLFVRLGHAVDRIGARRVALDTIEALFAGLKDTAILRAELRRLFRWLKERGLTAVVTAERGDGVLTRHGLEEYVSDCVVLLDHRVHAEVSTRRLRVVKYRGSEHGTNEYPFIIGGEGLSVLPITSAGLDHEVSDERVSSGVERLDEMLGGPGFYRGTSALVSGTAGTGKTCLAGAFVAAACRRGERALFFAFEESPNQLVRNLGSIGIDLRPWRERDLLHFHAARPTLWGLEAHLATMMQEVRRLDPRVVVIDPVSNLTQVGTAIEVRGMLLRLIDGLKERGITALFTQLLPDDALAETQVDISSLMDTWIALRDTPSAGEVNRALVIRKSRGMAHSNQVREYRITDHGIDLLDVYLGPGGALTGSARVAQEGRDRAAGQHRRQEVERLQRELAERRRRLDAELDALRSRFDAEQGRLERLIQEQQLEEWQQIEDRRAMARSRRAGPNGQGDGPGGPG